MRLFEKLLPVVLILGGLSLSAAAQTAAENAASLRQQLADVQAREEQLRAHLQELDEAMKPENIQNSLAGVGSVHPEDLREQRRRQLEKEKAAVNAQLEQLANSKRRLETAIAQADAAAYQQSAQPPRGPSAGDSDNVSSKSGSPRRHVRRAKAKHRVKRPAPSSQ